jgi:hypothetical protein
MWPGSDGTARCPQAELYGENQAEEMARIRADESSIESELEQEMERLRCDIRHPMQTSSCKRSIGSLFGHGPVIDMWAVHCYVVNIWL